jgi:predicted chitinase
MKKKYYILVFTFLCLFLGQVSYGLNINEGSGGDDEYDFPIIFYNTAEAYFTAHPENSLITEYVNASPYEVESRFHGVLPEGSFEWVTAPGWYAIPIPGSEGIAFAPPPSTNDICYSCDCDPFFCAGVDPNDTTLDICDVFPSYCGGSDDTNEDLSNTEPKQKWYVDKDNDNRDSGEAYFDIFVHNPGPQYKLATLGPDCDDNNINVQILNSCGICAVEPANGKCPCKTSAADLKAIFGPTLTDAKATQLADVLNKHADKFGIDTKEKLQYFLAQVKKETENLTKFTEDVEHYKLTSVSKPDHHFYKYFFPTNSQVRNNSYLRDISDLAIPGSPYLNAEKLSNIVYDDRNLIRDRNYLNGNNQDGDGYKFRGGGALHITGREKYTDFNAYYNSLPGVTLHDFTINPELIHNNTDNLGIIAGMWFFMTKVLKPIRDFQTRATSSDINEQIKLNKKVTKIVQGGTSSADERLENLELAEQKIKCN